MSDIFDKLRDSGVKIDFFMTAPIILVNIAVLIVSVFFVYTLLHLGAINFMTSSMLFMLIVLAWFFGAVLGGKIMLVKLKEVTDE